MTKDSKPLTDSKDYESLKNSSKSLEITVSKSETKVKTNLGIFKLRVDSDDLICTGFIISPQYAIIPSNFFHNHDVAKLRLLFEDETEYKINPQGKMIEIGFNLIAVELEANVLNLNLFLLSRNNSAIMQGKFCFIQGYCLYCSKKVWISLLSFLKNTL